MRECNAYAILRNRIKASKDSKRKVLSSIGEDMRDLYLLRFLLAMTHTEIQYDRIYCCHAAIHRLENFRCNIACERLLDVFKDRRNCDENATDHCL